MRSNKQSDFTKHSIESNSPFYLLPTNRFRRITFRNDREKGNYFNYILTGERIRFKDVISEQLAFS